MLPLFVSHALWFIPWATGATCCLRRCRCLPARSRPPPLLLPHRLAPTCRPVPPVDPSAGIYTVEGTGLQYTCDQGTLLRVANYSLFSLFGLAALNEALLFVLGLRGGC